MTAAAAAMVHAVRIDPHSLGGVSITPVGYLGPRFQDYLKAVSGVPGCTYDGARRCQRLADVARLPELLDALQRAHFGPIVHPDLLAVPAAVAEEFSRQRVAAEKGMAAAIERIAGSGLSPYPFQRDGIQWLAVSDAALLADEMGLGKTIQTLLALPENGYGVVVCPASLKGNWYSECLRWRPDLRPRVLGGAGGFRWPRAGELVIINDDVLPDGDLIVPPPGVVVIYDEAHRGKGAKPSKRERDGTIKHRGSARGRRFVALSKAARDNGGRVWLLTGTPLINRPPELKSILDLAGLFEKAYGTWPRFVEAFGGKKDRFGYKWGTPTPEAAEGLRRVALARRRVDVLPDLPTKTWETIHVDIESIALLEQMNIVVERLAAIGIDISKMKRSDLNDPIVFENMSRIRAALATAMIPAMLDVVERFEEEGKPLVVFSAHRAPIDLLEKREGWVVITGDTDPDERTRIVAAFQRGEHKGIAGTIRAMGVGVTLTWANHGLFVDLDYTPAGNSQAEDRICRIGQDRGVIITTLTANHPLIQRVNDLLQDKTAIIDGSVGEAARGRQSQASDLLADLAAREEQARAAAAALMEQASNGQEMVLRAVEETLQLTDRLVEETKPIVRQIASARYCLVEEDGALSFWIVDKPDASSRWEGWLFLNRQAGPEKHAVGAVRPNGTPTAKGSFTPEYTVNVLRRIANDPDALARYGRELGICGRCGLELTDEESRRVGIGPICRSR